MNILTALWSIQLSFVANISWNAWIKYRHFSYQHQLGVKAIDVPNWVVRKAQDSPPCLILNSLPSIASFLNLFLLWFLDEALLDGPWICRAPPPNLSSCAASKHAAKHTVRPQNQSLDAHQEGHNNISKFSKAMHMNWLFGLQWSMRTPLGMSSTILILEPETRACRLFVNIM